MVLKSRRALRDRGPKLTRRKRHLIVISEQRKPEDDAYYRNLFSQTAMAIDLTGPSQFRSDTISDLTGD